MRSSGELEDEDSRCRGCVGAVFASEGALLDVVRGVDEIAEDGFFSLTMRA